MNVNPQTLFAAQKNSFDRFLALQGAICEGVEKIVDLNITAWKSSLTNAAEQSEQATKLNDVQDSLVFASALVQPAADKSLSYSKQVYDIVSGIQNEVLRLSEQGAEQIRQDFADAIEQFAKNAPAGSEPAVAMMKSSLASANNAFDTVSKLAKQAGDAASANVNAVADKAFQAASAASAETKEATARTAGRRTEK